MNTKKERVSRPAQVALLICLSASGWGCATYHTTRLDRDELDGDYASIVMIRVRITDKTSFFKNRGDRLIQLYTGDTFGVDDPSRRMEGIKASGYALGELRYRGDEVQWRSQNGASSVAQRPAHRLLHEIALVRGASLDERQQPRECPVGGRLVVDS